MPSPQPTEFNSNVAMRRAWRAIRRGVPHRVLELQTIPVPQPDDIKPGHVLVRVQAAALNPAGYKLMYLLPNFVAGRPGIVEHDFAGVVAHSKSTEWSEGDPVFGWIPLGHALQTREGALAEYVVVPDNCLGRRSPSIKPTEAAGIAVAAMTAYEALIVAAKLEEGQSVFINGGSTSVGIWAIQLAKAVGARVVVSGSEKNREFLTNLGIDEFVDYTQQPSLAVHLAKEPPTTKYNVFFETVGLPDPSLYTLSEKYLAPNGIFISVGPQFHSLREVGQLSRLILNIIWPRVLGGVKRRYYTFQLDVRREYIAAVAKLINEGKAKSIVDSVYAFDDVLLAYERIMSSRARGKVVVKVDPDVE